MKFIKSGLISLIIISFINSLCFAQGFPHRNSSRTLQEAIKIIKGIGNSKAAYAFAPSLSGSGTYHSGAQLICSDCHIMHASQQHDYNGSTSGFPWTGSPQKNLLRKASALELCLSCHNNKSGIPDVVTSDINGLADRAAGYFGEPDTVNYKGHNLSTNPGDLCTRCHSLHGSVGVTAYVTCVDCHNPHGNGYYRNLQWASEPGGEPEIRAYINPAASGLQRYEADNIKYPAPPAGDNSYREVTNICIDCHHVFMDDSAHYYTKPGGMSSWGKHPGTNTEWGASAPINATGASTNPAHWVDGSGNGFGSPRLKFIVSGATNYSAAGVVAQNNEVFCLSCHKGHGTDNAFSLRWNASGAGTSTNSCLQCHDNIMSLP